MMTKHFTERIIIGSRHMWYPLLTFFCSYLAVLCKSVPVKEREVCMASGSKEECLRDNCCYDESAAPGQQCFFKPSAPGKHLINH